MQSLQHPEFFWRPHPWNQQRGSDANRFGIREHHRQSQRGSRSRPAAPRARHARQKHRARSPCCVAATHTPCDAHIDRRDDRSSVTRHRLALGSAGCLQALLTAPPHTRGHPTRPAKNKELSLSTPPNAHGSLATSSRSIDHTTDTHRALICWRAAAMLPRTHPRGTTTTCSSSSRPPPPRVAVRQTRSSAMLNAASRLLPRLAWLSAAGE